MTRKPTRTSPLSLEALEDRCLPSITTLSVTNDLPIARVAEPVTSGIPLPQSLGLTDPQQFRLLGPSGQAVPAEFSVLGRWNSGPQDSSKPIRWLEVSFDADIPANATASYTLDLGANPAPTTGIQLTQTADLIDITTGPARFEIDRNSFDLFHSVWLDTNNDGTFSSSEQIVAPSAANGSYVLQGTQEYRSSQQAPLSVVVEESGPLEVVVRAEGFHADSSGQDLLRYVTRLTFYAGQSYVDVNQTIIEGRVVGSGNNDLFDGNGQYTGQQQVTNFNQAGLRIALQLSGPVTAQLRGSQDTVQQGTLTAGGFAQIQQHRQTDLTVPMAYDAVINGTQVESGQQATRAWLDLSDSRWGLAITTKDFYQKDPEALRAAADGTVQVEFPSEAYTIFQAMGLEEDSVFYFHPAGTSTTQLQQVLEGFGKDRLLAVAPAPWMLSSGAFGTLPGANLPAPYANFNTFVTDSYNATLAWIQAGHTYGLLNYLDLPAYDTAGLTNPDLNDWGNSYYDPAAAVLNQFARTGNVSMLKQFVIPYVQHFYTTDAYDTNDPTSYQNGISGSRGGDHRAIWTGQYNYLESLWTYYYLTGDREALERGTAAAHSYANDPLWANNVDYGIGDLGLTTRNASQKYSTMLEAWLATGDASLKSALDTQLHDYLTHMYTAEGFVVFPYTHGTTYQPDQAFMVTNLIDDTVYKYYQVTGDSLARDFVVTTPQRIAQYNRISQDPTSPDYYNFYNDIQVTVTGPGTFTTKPLFPNGNSDDYLYLEAKLSLGTALARASLITGDQTLMTRAQELYKWGIPQLVGGLWQKDIAEKSLRSFQGLGILVSSAGTGPNQAPTLDTISDQTVPQGSPLSFTVTAQDADGDALTFSLDTGAPAGASIDPVTGVFSWTPAADLALGTYSITVRVTDSGTPTLSATASFNVQVTDKTAPRNLTLQATADNTLDGRFGVDTTANNGSSDVLEFYEDWSGGQFRPILRFDLPAAPAGTHLTGATLKLYHLGTDGGNTALPVMIQNLSRAWTEGGSSWANAQAGTPWQTPGGDVNPGGVNATVPAFTSAGWDSFDVTDLVSAWVNGEQANNGFLFSLAPGATDSTQIFASRESADATTRPVLELTFSEDGTGVGQPAKVSFITQPLASVTAGSTLGAVVKVVDQNGNAVAGTVVTLGISSGTLRGSLTATTDASGQAVFTGLSETVSGSYTLTASVAGLDPVSSSLFQVTPAALAGLSFSPGLSSVSAGSSFRPVVQLVDAFGNAVARAGVSVRLSLSVGNVNRTATASTNATGQAIFANQSVTVAGTGTLAASATGLGNVSSTLRITPAAAARLSFVTQPPSSMVAGSSISPVVLVTDQYGNAVAGATVNLALASRSSTVAASLATATTDASGRATFSNLSLTTAGTFTLQAAIGNLNSQSRSITVRAAAAANISFLSQPPASITAGSSFSPVVLVTDQFGNAVAGTAVSLSLSSGKLNGTATVRTNASGQAIFNLSETMAGTYTLQASVAGLAVISSNSFTVQAAAAARISLVSQPPTRVSAGQSFSVVVMVTDRFGNLVGGSKISLSLSSGQLGGSTSATSSAGSSTSFSNLVVNRLGTNTLRASVTGLSSITSRSFTVTAN